jgi:hypothetical protein
VVRVPREAVAWQRLDEILPCLFARDEAPMMDESVLVGE